MKTSTKFILAAVLLFLSAAMVYNLKLQAAFKKGDYKIPFSDCINLNFTGFKFIKLESAANINLKVVKGPFRVAVSPAIIDYAVIKLERDTLVIKANFQYGYRYDWIDFGMLVTCPTLGAISSTATYVDGDQIITDTLVRYNYNEKQTVVEGFELDTLHIDEDYGSNIKLLNNKINLLTAEIGKSNYSGSYFIVDTGNTIQHAEMHIKNSSRLWILETSPEQNIQYTLDPMASLIINGKSIGLLNQHVQNH